MLEVKPSPVLIFTSFSALAFSFLCPAAIPQSHRRQHNKDKPFKCHNCHRAYTDAASLEVHLATHTVKHAKVYTCSICSRAYTSVSVGSLRSIRSGNTSSGSRSCGSSAISCCIPPCSFVFCDHAFKYTLAIEAQCRINRLKCHL